MMMMVPVMAAGWLALMSSSPSEMCFRAASVPAVTVLELLDSSEEVEGDAGPASRGGDGERAGWREGGGGG